MGYMTTILNGIKAYIDDKVSAFQLTEEDALIDCYNAGLIELIVDSDNGVLVDESSNLIVF
jgi:hypothetical protein